MANYWYDLSILDYTNGLRYTDLIVICAETEEQAEDDLIWYLDTQYPEDEFEVDVYPYYNDEENENA